MTGLHDAPTIRVVSVDDRLAEMERQIAAMSAPCDDCTGPEPPCCCPALPGTPYCELHMEARRLLAEMDAA